MSAGLSVPDAGSCTMLTVLIAVGAGSLLGGIAAIMLVIDCRRSRAKSVGRAGNTHRAFGRSPQVGFGASTSSILASFLLLHSLIVTRAFNTHVEFPPRQVLLTGRRYENGQPQPCISFHVVACDTAGSKSPFGLCDGQGVRADCSERLESHFRRPLNVCANLTWHGYGWKLKQFAKYAAELASRVPRSKDKCEPVLLLLDGNDVILNKHVSARELERRFRAYGKQVLFSSETTCWVGRICSDKDIAAYYSHPGFDGSTVSPYINSALMGTAAALAEVLHTVAAAENDTDTFDDQKALTELMSGRLASRYSIGVDTRQAIFGSTVWSQPYPSHCPQFMRATHLALSCFDSTSRVHKTHGCCSNLDLSMGMQRAMFGIGSITGPEPCDIFRSKHDMTPDFFGVGANLHIPDAHRTLHGHPFLWHGNGPGKKVWRMLRDQAHLCRAEQKSRSHRVRYQSLRIHPYPEKIANHSRRTQKSAPKKNVSVRHQVAEPSHVYGFHMQAHRNGLAVVHLLHAIRSFYQHELIFVVTDNCYATNDGGLNYSSVCARFGCHWTAYASAAGHGQTTTSVMSGLTWLNRVRRSMRSCDCEYLINMEDDTCMTSPIRQRPPVGAVVGGLPFPKFSKTFLRHAAMVSGKPTQHVSVREHAPGWGCAGGCYFKVKFWLRLRGHAPALFTKESAAAASEAGAPMKYADVVAPAVALLAGALVCPWAAVSENGKGVNVSEATMEHKCQAQLQLRDKKYSALHPPTDPWATCRGVQAPPSSSFLATWLRG